MSSVSPNKSSLGVVLGMPDTGRKQVNAYKAIRLQSMISFIPNTLQIKVHELCVCHSSWCCRELIVGGRVAVPGSALPRHC